MNLPLIQQHWIRYRRERDLRVPEHARKGLDVTYWEADPQHPILVPRRSDFASHANFIHAARDFNLALHRLQMQADERRKEHHPHYKSIFRSGLKRAAKAAKGLELGLSMGGYNIPAYFAGLWGRTQEVASEARRLDDKAELLKRMSGILQRAPTEHVPSRRHGRLRHPAMAPERPADGQARHAGVPGGL